jgi:multiple antibiotic resistance protein
MAGELLSFILLSISSIVILVNPIGATLFYVSLTEGVERSDRRMVAKDACRLSLLVLVIFALAGSWILQLFGITIAAFRIAGGLLLFGIGMEMVYAKTPRTKFTATEKYEGIDAEDVAVMPLAFPMIAGPGSITTTIVLANEALQTNVAWIGIILLSIVLTILVTYILLLNADVIADRIGHRQHRVINRFMGILLIAIAVQFVIDGVTAAFPLFAGG